MESSKTQKNPSLLSKDLALLELFIARIELMIRESPSDDIFKAHCLFRLHEMKLIASECVKGLQPDLNASEATIILPE